MYLINFYGKNNIKMFFHNVGFFNFMLLIHYTSLCDEINCAGSRKAFARVT